MLTVTSDQLNGPIVDFLRARIDAMGAGPAGLETYYEGFARRGIGFSGYEQPIAEFLAARRRYGRYLDIGAGIGQIALLLAANGMTAVGVDQNRRVVAAMQDLFSTLGRDYPLTSLQALFPDPQLAPDRDTILVFSNFIRTETDEREAEVVAGCAGYGGIVMDLVRFVRARAVPELWDELSGRIEGLGYRPPEIFKSWGKPRYDKPRESLGGRYAFFESRA
jgi:SAM-dependent methyltransferase